LININGRIGVFTKEIRVSCTMSK